MLPAVLRGFSEQIQYEVKFPLKSNGWEGKLCYLQQQQCCSLLVSNEPAEGFILLISLQEPRQHILLACSFPRVSCSRVAVGCPGSCPVFLPCSIPPWWPLGHQWQPLRTPCSSLAAPLSPDQKNLWVQRGGMGYFRSQPPRAALSCQKCHGHMQCWAWVLPRARKPGFLYFQH